MNKYTINNIRKIAELKSGECLSKEYINAHDKLKWKCNICSFIWFANMNNIHSGTWCPKCSGGMKKNLNDCVDIAKRNNGRCLSTKYINNRTKLKLECSNRHIWYASYGVISKGHWCPKCGIIKTINNRRGDNKLGCIEEVKKFIDKKNGACLTDKYINSMSLLKIRCNKDKYEWFSSYDNLKHGRWCPMCASGRSERLCREYLKNKFKLEFIKCRPTWLKGLELDGYNEKLKLAFEYNGKQHYKFIPFFHNKNDKNFLTQQKRDKLKIELCKKNNIKLITIPYTYNCYNPNKMYKHIDSQLK